MALDYTDNADNAYDATDYEGAGDPDTGGGSAPAPTTVPSAPPKTSATPVPVNAPPAPAVKLPPGWVLDTPADPNGKPKLDSKALAAEPNPIVRMLVMGDYDPALMRRFKPEEQQALLQRAQQYDPGLDLSNYPAKAQAKKVFTSGKAADAIRSINQFIGHANSLADAEKSLNNSDGWFPTPVNWTENFVGSQFSPSLRERLGKFTPIKNAVGNEFENMVRSSSVSGVKERLENLQSLSEDSAPSAIKGWIDGALQVMNSRLNELQDQYKQGTGLQYGLDVLNPKSKSILKRFGVTPEDGGGVASVAATSRPTTPTAATTAPVSATTPPAVGSSTNTAAPRKQLDAATAQRFLQQANGNKDKARGLARAAGYDF